MNKGTLLMLLVLLQFFLTLWLVVISYFTDEARFEMTRAFTIILVLSMSCFIAGHATYWELKRMQYNDSADLAGYAVSWLFLIATVYSGLLYFKERTTANLTNKDWPYSHLENMEAVHWLFSVVIVGLIFAVAWGLRLAISRAIKLGWPKW